MRNSKHGLKVLVLGIMVVFSAMALAAGAQAQESHEEELHVQHIEKLHLELLTAAEKLTHAELLTKLTNHNKSGGTLNPSPLASPATNLAGSFLINLAPALLATVAASQIGKGYLLVAGRSLEIRCAGLNLSATSKIISSTDALIEITFTGCKSFDHKTLTELTTCLLKELETIKAKALVLPILHGPKGAEEPFLLFEPHTGATFTTVTYKPGIGCPLPLENPVTGSVTALVELLDAVLQLVLFSEGIQLLTGDVLKFGGFNSYILGLGKIELTGAHAGLKLGIH